MRQEIPAWLILVIGVIILAVAGLFWWHSKRKAQITPEQAQEWVKKQQQIFQKGSQVLPPRP